MKRRLLAILLSAAMLVSIGQGKAFATEVPGTAASRQKNRPMFSGRMYLTKILR